jgi:hypothetical protein
VSEYEGTPSPGRCLAAVLEVVPVRRIDREIQGAEAQLRDVPGERGGRGVLWRVRQRPEVRIVALDLLDVVLEVTVAQRQPQRVRNQPVELRLDTIDFGLAGVGGLGERRIGLVGDQDVELDVAVVRVEDRAVEAQAPVEQLAFPADLVRRQLLRTEARVEVV